MLVLSFAATLLQIVAYGLAAGALLALLVYWIRRRYRLPDAAPEIHFAETRDGWRLALHRYPPSPDAPRAYDVPVILCHGLGANRFQVDLEGKSLARQLAARGHDVWILELRGAGLSRGPKNPAAITFDDYVEEDLPAAVERVRAKTGAARLHWVGFSTGAMAAYAYASRGGAPLASIVGLGAPTSFLNQPNLPRFATTGWLLSYFGQVRLSLATTLFAPLGGRMNPRLLKAVMNRDNIEARDIRRGLASAVTNLSRDALRQYADWVLEDQFRSIDHRRDYRRQLGALEAPLLCIAGAQDILAPASSMEVLLKEASSPKKALKVAGREAGFGQDYGHADLAYGREAPREVFRWIEEWLEGGYAPEAREEPEPEETEPAPPPEEQPAPEPGDPKASG